MECICFDNITFFISDTKIDLNADEKETADVLGVSAIISYELQRTPTANYEFNFEDVIKVCNSCYM